MASKTQTPPPLATGMLRIQVSGTALGVPAGMPLREVLASLTRPEGSLDPVQFGGQLHLILTLAA